MTEDPKTAELRLRLHGLIAVTAAEARLASGKSGGESRTFLQQHGQAALDATSAAEALHAAWVKMVADRDAEIERLKAELAKRPAAIPVGHQLRARA